MMTRRRFRRAMRTPSIDNCTLDVSGRVAFHRLHAWGDVELIYVGVHEPAIEIVPEAGAASAGTRVSLPSMNVVGQLDLEALKSDPVIALFVFEDVAEVWTLDDLMRGWVLTLNESLLRAVHLKHGHAEGAHLGKLRNWCRQTAALADRVQAVFGQIHGIADIMRGVVADLEHEARWPADRLTVQRADGARSRADLLFRVNLWGFDQFMGALNKNPVSGVAGQLTREAWLSGKAGVKEGLFDALQDLAAQQGFSIAGKRVKDGGDRHGAFKQRIYQIEKEIRTGERENLMNDLLWRIRDEEVRRMAEAQTLP